MLDWITGNSQVESLLWARPVSSSVLILALLGALLLTLALYRRAPGMPLGIRILLGASRFAMLCILVTALFEPTLTVNRKRTTKKRLSVMVDVSQSMSIQDQRKRDTDIMEAATAMGYAPATNEANAQVAVRALGGKQRRNIAEASRLDLAKSLLEGRGAATLQDLGNDLDVNYYAFGSSLKMLKHGQIGGTNSLASLKAVETSTTLAESLSRLAGTGRGLPLAGIVLLSDGLDTSLRRSEAAISDLGEHGVPIYPVPVGIADPDDVSIRTVVIQEVAFSGDKVPVRAQIKSKGYEKRLATLKVELNGRVVSRKSISLKGGLQFEDIFFHVDIYEKAAAKVGVVIEPFKDEATAENNRAERSVSVVNEKINILCIEGSARWEYRYLRAMLKRDPRFDTTFIATRAKPDVAKSSAEYIPRFPELREEAFEYDLVILGDVDAEFFTTEELSILEELIRDRGGSLLVLCGSRFTPTSYGGTVVEKMLPVAFEPEGEWEDVDDSVYPVLTPEGRSSLVMTLETDREKNDRIWSRVAPLHHLPPLGVPKPGATVLASLSDTSARNEAYPFVTWQRYGAGKCMAIASDRLWMLRFKMGDKYHWRVWSQSLQFLTLSRLMGEHKRIRLETDRSTYQEGERVLLYANVLDDSYNPENRSGFRVEVTSLDDAAGAISSLRLVPNVTKPGLFEGYFNPATAGRYQVRSNADDADYSNTSEFQVTDLNPEMANTDMQLETLQRIADISGGECLSLSEFNKLATIVDRTPHTATTVTDHSLWRNGWLALLLIALMGFEWILRRRYDLP
ncbi:MAG: hypothetical protein HN919_21735 [Verrucomicrobia bacterium]|jgi:hypothetical protein|nr:hypothetical protein [Verrucomicrobiota bacterium]MBT7068933.1 hypothetical protein [Verrucomicrobiota bacterium]MBT7701801.1 hypothetical protein [Verrucomicrobiota bacterium]